ncbi:MAG: site-specific integrase [Oscillospiraceae bacterium]|nr:site-specific integrase [Oscillospiraceae bacterium]
MKQMTRKPEAEKIDGVQVTNELIDSFLKELAGKGRRPASVRAYQGVLAGLFDDLPGDKLLTENTAGEWRQHLKDKGYSPRTVNTRLSVLNSFLGYLGRREWQYTDALTAPAKDIQPELTRSEYLRLLQAAKHLGRERTYLLIKTMGGAGVRLQELGQLTVEAVRRGGVQAEHYGCKRQIRLPILLRDELIAYAGREGIDSGPVFVTKEGSPMLRSSVWNSVNSVASTARVQPEKANPRCLQRMYQTTYQGVWDNVAALTEQAYQRMLEEEQLTVGWDE